MLALRFFPTRRSSDLEGCFHCWIRLAAWNNYVSWHREFSTVGGSPRRNTYVDRRKFFSLVSVATLLHLRWVCLDRKSTRLNSSHLVISYAVFCLNKKI